ncbi:hypothetical protein MSAN_01983300 [Mycena sanguinolenta]|uniref:Uncharacterized protein n=1 Tax=Mycena sanguinolenta TaxID=230812 RepID=A0A8H6XNG8_9AGAR|nr:hypothetical protein MSAN_01983300 [Mycena sanguinolenta]
MVAPGQISDEIGDKHEAGGRGGNGQCGPTKLYPRWIDNSSEIMPPQLDTVMFCKKYRLNNDIRDLLMNRGCHSIDSLFAASQGGVDFSSGKAAELRWALRRMLLGKVFSDLERAQKRLSPQVSSTGEGPVLFCLYGGSGGRGGTGDKKGGSGGVGGSASYPGCVLVWSIFRSSGSLDALQGGKHDIIVHDIRGGIGGNGSHDGIDGAVGKPSLSTRFIPHGNEIGTSNQACVLTGYEFHGGTGGEGGKGYDTGGDGGTGEAPTLSTLIVPLDDEIRLRVPYRKLKVLGFSSRLCQLLEEQGFETVGGLLEAFDIDFRKPHFKLGHIFTVKAALKDFIAVVTETRRTQDRHGEDRHDEDNRPGSSQILHKPMQPPRGKENRPGDSNIPQQPMKTKENTPRHSHILHKSFFSIANECPRLLIPTQMQIHNGLPHIPSNQSAASLAILVELYRQHSRAENDREPEVPPESFRAYLLCLPSTISAVDVPIIFKVLHSLGILLELPLGASHDETLLTPRLDIEIATQVTLIEVDSVAAPESAEATLRSLSEWISRCSEQTA